MTKLENDSPQKRKRVEPNIAYPLPKNMGMTQYQKDFKTHKDRAVSQVYNQEIEANKTFTNMVNKNKFSSDKYTTAATSYLFNTIDNNQRIKPRCLLYEQDQTQVNLDNQVNSIMLRKSTYGKDYCNWGDRKEKLVFKRPEEKYYGHQKFMGETGYSRQNHSMVEKMKQDKIVKPDFNKVK